VRRLRIGVAAAVVGMTIAAVGGPAWGTAAHSSAPRHPRFETMPPRPAPKGLEGQHIAERILPGRVRGLDTTLLPEAGRQRFAGARGRLEPAARDRAGRVVVYVEGPDQAALRRAMAASGGVVTGAVAGRLRAAVPASSLVRLAGAPGVREVRRPDRAVPMSITSEGVAASGADLWQQDGRTGAGAKVGVIDIAFDGLEDAQQLGELPATGSGVTLDQGGCAGVDPSPHGTAVAEVVHDMAPGAQLYLTCAPDTVGFANAAAWLSQQGVKIVVAAIGFPGTGRGDGTGTPDTPVGVVRQGRESGQLWVVAAGNTAHLHFSGNATDSDKNGWVEFTPTAQADGFAVPPMGQVTLALQWDAWPTTNEDLDLYVVSKPALPTGPTDPNIVAVSARDQKGTSGGLSPTEQVTVKNTTANIQNYSVLVADENAQPTTRIDLWFSGQASAVQYDSVGGSVAEPASSPYALAVGATQPGSGAIEPYSGQGPTIDDRTKPDITGFDQVSTSTYGPTAFGGTSAAAAHVAGAAALIKGANPNLDASTVEGILEGQVSPRRGDNLFGYGVLAMGPSRVPQAPQGDPYTPLAEPKRILDTRTSLGGHQRPLGSGETFTLPLNGLVPNDTSAVVVNLTGVDATAVTNISAFPEKPTNASNLQLPPGEARAVMAVVRLASDRAIRLRNDKGQANAVVDLLGYFNSLGASTYFPARAPQRILDTRTSLGGHARPLGPGETVAVPIRGVAGVPSDATAVALNVTGVTPTSTTDLDVFSQDYPKTSTLNLLAGQVRANLDIVGIAFDGSIRVRNGGQASVHVLIDVLGYFGHDSKDVIGGRYVALHDPLRVLDSRTGNGLRHAPLGAGETMRLPVAGLYGVPPVAGPAMLTLTGVQATAGTYLTAWNGSVPFSDVNVSSLNLVPFEQVANMVAPPAGNVAIRNDKGGVQVIGDLSGYFTPSPPAIIHPGG
jgi:Subtilase family